MALTINEQYIKIMKWTSDVETNTTRVHLFFYKNFSYRMNNPKNPQFDKLVTLPNAIDFNRYDIYRSLKKLPEFEHSVSV